jgi:tetratricopeptide (TPR) repeat protein
MLRKHFSSTLATLALLTLSTVVSAQTGQLRGHVKLKQADGTMVPAVGAAIDVFRIDLDGKYPTKTDKKGEFVFAGLPYVGTYAIGASLANAEPAYLGNVKAGRDIDYELVLSPGNGHRLTLDEIKRLTGGGTDSGAAPAGTGGRESAEDKAKRAELEKKNKEISEANERNSKINEVVGRTFKAGNDALVAKNYDEAIKQYEEGLAADPEQAALYTQKANALRMRGVERYNAAIQSKDDAAKTSGLELAKQDFKQAAEVAGKAVELLKKESPPTDPAAQAAQNGRKLAALSTRAESMRLYVSKADQSQADAGITAYQEYIAAETDATRKNKAQRDAAQMLLDAGAGDKAYVEFQKILASAPDDPDANLGAGLALFSTGDKAKYQEAANYLQHFVDLAPDTHKFKADAKAILAEMKNTENVVPEKTTPTRRRKP